MTGLHKTMRNGPGIYPRRQIRDLPQGISFRLGENRSKPYQVRVGKNFFSKSFSTLREAVKARDEQVALYNRHHGLQDTINEKERPNG